MNPVPQPCSKGGAHYIDMPCTVGRKPVGAIHELPLYPDSPFTATLQVATVENRTVHVGTDKIRISNSLSWLGIPWQVKAPTGMADPKRPKQPVNRLL